MFGIIDIENHIVTKMNYNIEDFQIAVYELLGKAEYHRLEVYDEG